MEELQEKLRELNTTQDVIDSFLGELTWTCFNKSFELHFLIYNFY